VINLNVTVFTRRQCAPDVTCDYEFAIFSVDNQFLVDNFQNFSSRVSDTSGRSHDARVHTAVRVNAVVYYAQSFCFLV